MNSFLTKEIAEKAISIVVPTIEEMFKSGLAKRKALAVTVLQVGSFDVLAMRSFGACPSTWERPFGSFAEQKAILAQRTKMDTLEIAQRFPHLFELGDCKYPGGVYRDGIAVGASGIDWWYDQMVAEMVAAACKGLCIEHAQKRFTNPSPHI